MTARSRPASDANRVLEIRANDVVRLLEIADGAHREIVRPFDIVPADVTRALIRGMLHKSSGRIDGMVALTMAMGVAGQYAENVDVNTLIF